MASGSYAISGLNLGDGKGKKRDRLGWKVEADKPTAKRGDVITFTITVKNGKFPDGTKRKFVLSENFSEADIVDGKISGEFELFGNQAKVEIGIEETYEREGDEILRFGVTSTFASASVTVESDGGKDDIKRLRGREQKKLPSRQEPVQRVRVRQLELPPGKGSIVPRSSTGMSRSPGGGLSRTRRALPPGGPRLPGTAARPTPSAGARVRPQSSGLGDLFNQATSGVGSGGQYLSKEQRIAAFKKARVPRATSGVKPISSLTSKGGAIGKVGSVVSKSVGGAAGKAAGKTAGKAVAKGAGKAVAKKIPGLGLLAGAAFGLERLIKGDILGAVGEIASGAASTIPGIGTAVSLGIDGALMAGDVAGVTGEGGMLALPGASPNQAALPPAKFKDGATIIPGMSNMPFSLPGLNGIFNEPGNPEIMSITPMKAVNQMASMIPGLGGIGMVGDMLTGGGPLGGLFGGKKKEYKGIAEAIADEMDKRGFGDPFGIQGKGKQKSFGDMTRDMLEHAFPGLKNIFGGGGNNGSGTGTNTSGPSGSVTGGNEDNMLAAYLSTLEGGSGQNAADAMQVMLNRAAQNHSGYGSNVGDQAMAEHQFTPFSAAIYGPGRDPAANAAYGHIAPMLGRNPEERKAKLREIVRTEGFAGLDRIFNKNSAQDASAVLQDFQQGGPMSQLARKDVQGRAYFKGQSDIKNMKAGDMYRGTGGNYFHDDRNLSTLTVGTLQNAAPTGGLNSPTLTPMPGGGGQTVVLAGGTNTADDPYRAAQDMTAAIRNLKNKGYNVVVVPPNGKDRRFKSVHDAVKNSAQQEGVEVIEAIYDKDDPLHLSAQAVTSIRSKYPNAIYMGDSNAVRLNGYVTQAGVNKVGAQTSEIKQQAQNFQRAAQAPVAAAPQTQMNAGFQQMSYTNTRGPAQQPGQVQAASPYAPTAATEGILMGPGTFVQGNTGDSGGDHFHIGPETELWGKPEGKTEARKAAFKVAKGLIAKKETFTFTNANITVDGNNPPDDGTLMRYVEQEQAAHAARSGGSSFGGLDIAGRKGLRMPLGVSDVRDRGDGFGISGTIAGTRAFVGHGMSGSTATPGTATMMPGQSPNGTMLMSNNTQAPPPGNPADFFSFARDPSGRSQTAPQELMATSAQMSAASSRPPVVNMVNNSNRTSAPPVMGGPSSAPSQAGPSMDDAGLLAYSAWQRLLTIGV